MRFFRRRLLAGAIAVAFAPAFAAAQQTGSVQGVVLDSATGLAVPNVQVTVAGTTLGTITSSQGRFHLDRVPLGAQRLQARRIGYITGGAAVTIQDGQTATVEIRLAANPVQLEGMVVTALGIERAKRAVSNSVQEVEGADVSKTGEPNLVTALTGKVSGVTITNSNTEGGSSRIVIRGPTSVTNNNQPLFVVDGVPVSNSSTSGDGYGAIDYGNAIQDLNPEDIKSISVLKGPTAAALYGSRAANGVIIITTKDGAGATGMGVTADITTTFETPLELPTYQNKYGQGYSGRFEFVDGDGGGINDNVDESWGPPLDAGLEIPQWFSNGQPAPWVSHPDNVRSFFETGQTTRINGAVEKSAKNANVRLSVSNLDQNGMYPGFKISRTTAALNGGVNINDKLHAKGTVQYTQADGEGRPAQGYDGDNFMLQFVWFGRQVDMHQLRHYKDANGNMLNWNYSYHNNPYWIALENENKDRTNRIIGSASLTYDFTNWLTGTVRSGTDWSRGGRKRMYAPNPLTSDFDVNGGFSKRDIVHRETNTDFLLTANRQLTPSLGLVTSVGGNRRESLDDVDTWTVYNLVVPYLYDLNNAAATPILGDYTARSRTNSLYGVARLDYRDWFFVEGTGRNDWSSTLPAENRSYFYPSVSGSFIFTDALHIGGPGKFLSFGKLRAGWAQVGNDADPYQLQSVYVSDQSFGGVPMFGAGNTIANANLKPEQTKSWEVGTELRFLNDRLGVEATYYSDATSNQIIPVQISPLTGYTSEVINAGKIENRGIELLVDGTPIKTGGFQWDVSASYGKNDNEVAELTGDAETLVLHTYYGLRIEAHKGQPYGAMYGVTYVRDGKGNIIVGSNGIPLKSKELHYLGSYQPDWTGGLRNTFSYKGLRLSALIDTKQGGKIYSLTNNYGRKSGTLIQTLYGRENGETIADGGGLIVPGVKVVGTDTVPNDIEITSQAYFHGLDRLHEEYVYDASFVKLREVTLSYALPKSLTSRMGVSRATLSLIGRNLALWTDVPNIDPETAFDASNIQGLEYGQAPSARSFGFALSVTP